MRPTGAIVADRAWCLPPPFALWISKERGELFIGPAIQVYEDLILGENS